VMPVSGHDESAMVGAGHEAEGPTIDASDRGPNDGT